MARNKSENPDAWIVELITFAALSESMEHRESLAKGSPLRAARNALCPQAMDNYNPKKDMTWKEIANHIFERYGRGHGTQSK